MAKSHRGHVSMLALRCGKRRHQCRDLRIDPELAMNTLNQLQLRRELPRELPEDLVLLIRPWESGIGAGLAVGVAKVLISRKEPKPIAMHRTAEIRREVPVFDALISRGRLTARTRDQNRLAGQAFRLTVIRRVIGETITPLPGDDIDYSTLNVPELRRCAHTLNLNFLNDVHAGFGARCALTRTGEVRAVNEKHVLADTGAESGH